MDVSRIRLYGLRWFYYTSHHRLPSFAQFITQTPYKKAPSVEFVPIVITPRDLNDHYIARQTRGLGVLTFCLVTC